MRMSVIILSNANEANNVQIKVYTQVQSQRNLGNCVGALPSIFKRRTKFLAKRAKSLKKVHRAITWHGKVAINAKYRNSDHGTDGAVSTDQQRQCVCERLEPT